jgi:hypothetical protein
MKENETAALNHKELKLGFSGFFYLKVIQDCFFFPV